MLIEGWEWKCFNGCNEMTMKISPRGYLYIIILAMGSFNDTQFNMFRSLLLLACLPASRLIPIHNHAKYSLGTFYSALKRVFYGIDGWFL
jgi:hypothetical protein